LSLILQQLQGRSIVLVIDDTGDRKKGKTTDYVARQYIGNLGKVDNGIVSVNAYGVLGGITFPLLFKVFKPQGRLKEQDGDIPSFNWLKKSFKSNKHLDLSLSWSWQIVSMASVTRLSGY
jgi:SRSO17 transposase